MLRDNATEKGGGVVVKIHTFLIFAMKACGRSASSFAPFTPVGISFRPQESVSLSIVHFGPYLVVLVCIIHLVVSLTTGPKPLPN